ncbi:hypothetical protein [Luteimonas mephitis]|uniref:hypothetical protein n=1 Tax=Luteimonas mephitis TaxID=83615 RepID=UPI003A8EF807
MKTAIALIVLASLPSLASAAPQETTKRTPTASFSTPDTPVTGRMVLRESTGDALATQTQALLTARPDIRWRIAGEQARSEGRDEEAYLRFQRAARYGDKQAQSILARMHHDGSGAVRDPALAFAWMAIAAERGDGTYVQLRDRYWRQLDATQRTKGEAHVQALQAEYGDAQAVPRLRRSIRTARHQATGSRLGYAGALEVTTTNGSSDTSGTSLSGPEYYDKKYWRSPQSAANQAPPPPAGTSKGKNSGQ